MNPLAQFYRLSESENWRVVIRHFELGEGFAFLVILVPNQDGVSICQEALRDFLAGRGKRLRVVNIDSYEALENIAETLLSLEPEPDEGAIWVARAVPVVMPDYERWREAWRLGVARLNQHRNPLRRQIAIPLIFVGAPWLQEVLRESAPDLWSVRTLVTRVEPDMPESHGPESLLRDVRVEGRSPEHGPDPILAMQEAERLRTRGVGGAALGRVLARAGAGFRSRGDFGRAIEVLEEALTILNQSEETRLEAASTAWRLASVLTAVGRIEESTRRLREAATAYHALGEPGKEAGCLLDLANLAVDAGRTDDAETLFRESLELARRGDPSLVRCGVC